MANVHLVLYVAAFVCELLAAVNAPLKPNLQAAGLALFFLTFII